MDENQRGEKKKDANDVWCRGWKTIQRASMLKKLEVLCLFSHLEAQPLKPHQVISSQNYIRALIRKLDLSSSA